VGDIAAPVRNALVGGPFGSDLVSRDYVPEGVPVIRGQNMSGRWVSGDFVFVTDDKAVSLAANLARPGDIVFTQRGTLGQVSLVPDRPFDRYLVSQSQMKLTLNHEIADSRFVYYFFSTVEQQDYIRQNAIQAGVPHTNLGILRSTPVVLPPLDDQRRIASVLGTLDDKIELNRRMNETLEAMARLLFKSWFVDFDPVRAKAECRDTGLPKPLADLFPDSHQESALGETPKGWRIGSVLEHARLMSGGTPKTNRIDYWDGPISWASAKDVSQSTGSFLVETERTITAAGLDESSTQMIPALSSVVVARGATTGRMVMFGRDMAMNQTCYALVTTTKTPFVFYCSLREAMSSLVLTAHGSVFDTITTSTFEASRVVLPPKPLLDALEDLVAPLFLRMLTNINENRSLAALRDVLLPKLISGELRVKDAERFVSASA
jgi:type I restriction enzyme, S subunit